MRAAAADPALAAHLRSPDGASRAAAKQALQGLRTAAEAELPIMLWDRARRPLLHVGHLPRRPSRPAPPPGALPDTTGVGSFFADRRR